MTIRTRLALWYTGLLALIIIIFSIAVLAVSRVTILRTIDQVLRGAATEIVDTISLVPVGDFGPPEMEIEFRSEQVFNAPGVSVQVWQTHQTNDTNTPSLVRNSTDINNQNQSLDPLSLDANQPIYNTITRNGIPQRVVTMPFHDNTGRQIGLVQVASPIRAMEQSNDILLVVIVISATISIIVSIGLGLWVSRQLLHPIEGITAAAASIADADDLSTRLEWDGPQDELGRLTEVFNHTMERLEHLFSVQQRFIGDVSHELRTPLTSILGNLELMQHYGYEEESVDAIHREAKRMSRMVNDLLLLTRADFGELEVDFYPIDLDTIVLNVYEEALVLKKDQEISIELGRVEHVRVEGNSDRIKQLILNLISNAIKFTGEGGTVTLAVYPNHNGQAVISVKDTGIGISEEHLSRIFDRFFQVDASRVQHSETDGAGLGLSIVRWIVDIHGGEITVTSEIGEGTHFKVLLPLTRSDDKDQSDGGHTALPSKNSTPIKISKRGSDDRPRSHSTSTRGFHATPLLR